MSLLLDAVSWFVVRHMKARCELGRKEAGEADRVIWELVCSAVNAGSGRLGGVDTVDITVHSSRRTLPDILDGRPASLNSSARMGRGIEISKRRVRSFQVPGGYKRLLTWCRSPGSKRVDLAGCSFERRIFEEH